MLFKPNAPLWKLSRVHISSCWLPSPNFVIHTFFLAVVSWRQTFFVSYLTSPCRSSLSKWIPERGSWPYLESESEDFWAEYEADTMWFMLVDQIVAFERCTYERQVEFYWQQQARESTTDCTCQLLESQCITSWTATCILHLVAFPSLSPFVPETRI